MASNQAPKSRIARSELRDLLLDTGVELMTESGVRPGIDHLTYRAVFSRVEERTGRRITAASVYDRLWANQAEFQWDVLATLIERANVVDARSRLQIEAIAGAADYSSPAGRWAALADICRSAVSRHVTESALHPPQQIVTATMAALAASEPKEEVDAQSVERVEAAIGVYLENQASFYLEVYSLVGFYLGLRLKDDLDLRQFVLVVHALADGIATRLPYFPEYADPVRLPDDSDHTPPSSLAGLGVYAIAELMLEIDPDWSPDRLEQPWPGIDGGAA